MKKIIYSKLDMKHGQFTVEEHDSEVKKTNMKSGKAAGFDAIPCEVWKSR